MEPSSTPRATAAAQAVLTCELPDATTAITRTKILVLVAAFLGWMFDGLEMGIFPQIARPALSKLLANVTEDKIKWWHQFIDAMFLWGGALGGLVFGWLGDKIGRVKAMSTSIVVYSIFTGLLYFVTTPQQIAGLRFVAAIGMGGEWALGVALVMEVWDAKHRPLMAGLIGAASNVGFFLVGCVTFVHPVTPTSWRYVALIGMVPALLMIFIQAYVPESHKWQESQKQAKSRPLSELFGNPRTAVLAIIAIALATVILLGTWGAVQKIPAWVDTLPGHTPRAKGLAQILTGAGAVVGCLIAPKLAAVLNRRVAYLLLCLGAFTSLEVLFLGVKSYGPQFIVMTFLVGVTSAAFYGWLPLYLPELFPTRVRATAQGIAYNFGRIMAGFGAISGAMIGSNYGHMGAWVSTIYLLGMGIIWLAPETKGKPLPE